MIGNPGMRQEALRVVVEEFMTELARVSGRPLVRNILLADKKRPERHRTFLKWLEDCLLPDDMEGYARVRERTPGTTLATGEHWYGVHPFAQAAHHEVTQSDTREDD